MNTKKALRMAVAVAGLFIFSGCSDMTNREDFASQLKDKTEPEVLKFAGKPAEIDRSSPDHVAWIYKSRTFDVTSRKTDPETDVIFAQSSDGKLHVASVVFK